VIARSDAQKPLICESFPVGERWMATISIARGPGGKPGAMAVEWAPHNPGRLSPREWNDYRAGRDAVLAKLAQQLGGRVAVVELQAQARR